MSGQVQTAWRPSIPWLALALLAVIVLGFRFQLSFDLSAFFPHNANLTHEILLEQLSNGPGSRLLVIGINGGERKQRAEISNTIREELAANPAFSNVLNGETSAEALVIPEPVNSYYLLLDEIDFSESSLHQAIQLRLQDLAFSGGSMMLDLIAKDPFLVTLDVLERLTPLDITGAMWFAVDGSAVVMAETRAAAVDLAAQEEAVQAINMAFSNILDTGGIELDITGVGAFGVELQQTIRAEAKKRSIMASAALILVLLIIYRRAHYLILAALPIGMGFLVGLAAVSVVFESTHGITIAFGFTLLGIAIDYPLHLFSHSQSSPASTAMGDIWPTMRLGVISTITAYLAIALSGSVGLAQLGVFTASGVFVAALVTRTWVPVLLGDDPIHKTIRSTELLQPRLIYYPSVILLVLAVFITFNSKENGFWDNNLSTLSPVPQDRLETDMRLRSAAGTPDLRYELVLSAASLESLLQQSEFTDLLLQAAVNDGLLDSWQSVSQVLPSQQVQKMRQAGIPEKKVLEARLGKAVSASPFRMEAFEPFELQALASRSLAPLLPSHFENTSLESWLGSHLLQLDDLWVSLISLNQPKALELAERIKSWDVTVDMVDLQQSSIGLMRDYRSGAISSISIACLVIIAVLLVQLRQRRKLLWIVLTVTASLFVTIALISVAHGKLNIIHLIALILVLGLGLDYALFLSREETGSQRKATQQAVLACALSTSLAFGVLAGSSIPVLKYLGLTVASGSAASFLLAAAGSVMLRVKTLNNDS